MDSLSTNNPDDKDSAQPAEPVLPAGSSPAPESPKPAQPVVPAGASMAAGTDELGKPVSADDGLSSAPKIDLLGQNPAPEPPPAPAPVPVPAAPAKQDLAGYEAADAAAVKSAEARPAVMAQTAGQAKRSPVIWIVLGLVILAAAGGGGYWYLSHRSSGSTATSPSPTPSGNIALTSPSPSASPVPSETPSPSPSTTPAPSTAPQPALSLSIGGQTVASGQSVSVTTNRPVFSGTAPAGSMVNLTLSPENIGLSATAAQDGSWSIAPNSDLPNGDHSASLSDGSAQLAFQLSVNPSSASGSSLAQTGDPVAIVSLLAALVLAGSLAGLRLTRRHG